jgi:mevalonate pyrophosphate decarboxylase
MLKQLLVSEKKNFLSFRNSISVCLAHCLDRYTKLQVDKFQSEGSSHIQIDQRLEDIVNRMFQRCFDDKKYKQVDISYSFLLNSVFFVLGDWYRT